MKNVYTIEDLRNPARELSQLEKPARLAVIGDPIAHSKSPQLHQPALDTLYAQSGEEKYRCSYIRVHLNAEDFSEGLNLMQQLGFIGCNVTVPHKERALAWGKNIAPFSAQVGVSNTIRFSDQSCLTTDPLGLENALLEVFHYPLKDAEVLLLGAGGGAGAAVAHHIEALPYRRLHLYNRTREKLGLWEQKAAASPATLHLYGGEELPPPETYRLVINATSLGLKQTDTSPLPEEFLRPHHLVYDMTYGCENALAQACKKVGARYADGLSMLRHQGAEAFKHWFPEVENPIAIMGLTSPQ